jgi:outer membrane immunogenic protein
VGPPLISYDFAKNNTQWNNYDWYPPNAPWSVNPQALGTVRARLGYAADRALFYVTGGLAYGDPNATVALTSSGTPEYSWTSNGWRTGYAVGGGVEYALSHTVTARVEGLYYNLGSTTVSDSLGSGDTFTFKDSGLLVRAGLNLKLGGY